MLSEQEAIEEQKKLRDQVITEDVLPEKIRYIGGVDVGYPKSGDQAVAVLSVMDMEKKQIVEVAHVADRVVFPYIPGLFSFRELPLLLKVLDMCQVKPDIIVCDGQGIAHPRRFGLASHLGVTTGIPTIGCAKKCLIGEYEEPKEKRGAVSPIISQGEIIGNALRTQDGVKPLYISVGHKISLETACSLVLQLAVQYRQPEVIRSADHEGRVILKELK